MKKILVLGGIAMIALASCKKTKNCECTIDNFGVTSKVVYPVEGTKSDRKEICDAWETNYSNIYSSTNCTVD